MIDPPAPDLSAFKARDARAAADAAGLEMRTPEQRVDDEAMGPTPRLRLSIGFVRQYLPLDDGPGGLHALGSVFYYPWPR